MKKKLPFKGLCTALVTPFLPDGDRAPDLDALDRLIEFQIAGGADALLILGTTGEAATVRDDEREIILRRAVETVRGRVPVVAGCGSNSTPTAVRYALQAEEAGCDAVLSVTPYYNKATKEGLVRHFEAVADAGSLPVILYNVPSRTGVDIPMAVYEKLAVHPSVAGVKEASGDIRRAGALCAAFGEDLAVYAGNDAEIVPVCALGGKGAFSVASNLFPAPLSLLCRRMRDGKTEEAARIQRALCPLADALFSEVNPVPVKAACAMMGLCSDAVRLPLTELSPALREPLSRAAEGFRKAVEAGL